MIFSSPHWICHDHSRPAHAHPPEANGFIQHEQWPGVLLDTYTRIFFVGPWLLQYEFIAMKTGKSLWIQCESSSTVFLCCKSVKKENKIYTYVWFYISGNINLPSFSLRRLTSWTSVSKENPRFCDASPNLSPPFQAESQNLHASYSNIKKYEWSLEPVNINTVDGKKNPAPVGIR